MAEMNVREAQFADFLTSQNLAWAFEPIRFKVGKSTYLPDFYCPDNDIFYEVVGTNSTYHQNKEKVKRFIRIYPHINFKYVHPDGSLFVPAKPSRKRKKPTLIRKIALRMDEDFYNQILAGADLIRAESPSEFIRMSIENLLYDVLENPAQAARKIMGEM